MSQLSPATVAALQEIGLDPEQVESLVEEALAEDLACGPDVTTAATAPAAATGIGEVTARAAGVVAGLGVAVAVLDASSKRRVGATLRCRDGERVGPGQVLLVAEGLVADLLTAERTMLNFLTHLSGVATCTRAWVDAVAGTGAVIRDTRKTTPRLRALEKYAVRCGGGQNHRMGLGDAALIKDNHILAAGGVAAALAAVRRCAPGLPVEVECDTVGQVEQALAAGAESILLDNMQLAEVREAVRLCRAAGDGVRLEASGGLALATSREVAATGVDYLAVGALTHSAPALDIGLDLRAG